MGGSKSSEEDLSLEGDRTHRAMRPHGEPYTERDNSKIYQLNKCICEGTFEEVRSLINSGVEVNRPSSSGGISVEYESRRLDGLPIYHAASRGTRLTQLLIDAGAEVDRRYRSFGTALQKAACYGDFETMELLIQAGANVNAAPGAGGTAIIRAIESGIDSFRKVRLLLQHGADVNDRDQFGTPLERVFQSKRFEFAPILLARGANLMAVVQSWQRKRSKPFPSLWLHIGHQQPYNSLDEVSSSIAESELAPDTVRIIQTEWEIPEQLKTDHSVSSKEDDYSEEEIFAQCWEQQFVLVADMSDVSGTSCSEFVSSRWGPEGQDFLRCLVDNIRLACQTPEKDFKIVHSAYHNTACCGYVHSLSVQQNNLKLWLSIGISDKYLRLISGVVSFLSKAIRTSPRISDDFALTTMEAFLEIDPEDLTNIDRPFILRLCSREKAFRSQKPDCWKQLFVRGVVACDKIVAAEHQPKGKGLCMSYNHMIAVSSVAYSINIQDTVVLLGYRTALIATGIHEDYVQYHVHVSECGQINPYNLNLKCAASVKGISELQKRHCYVGWCTEAHIRAGTEDLVRVSLPCLSRTRTKKKSLHMDTVGLGLQAASVVPLQAGANIQFTSKYVTNRVRFPSRDIYSELLRDTSRELVLVYDSGSSIGLLLPKLGLLVHMCHIYLAKHDEPSRIPFLPGHVDARVIIDLLEREGSRLVYGKGQDALLFRDLVQRLNINMLRCAEQTDDSTSSAFYGYEFLDIALATGKGAYMKQVNIKRNGHDLLRIARIVDAVVVGENLGNIIEPITLGTLQEPCACSTVPSGFNYVIAPVSCLDKLASGHGGSNTPFVKLTNSTYWAVSERSFQACSHPAAGKSDCWYRTEMFQRLSSNTSENAGMDNKTTVSTQVPRKGAVVFGKPMYKDSRTRNSWVPKSPVSAVFGTYKRAVKLFKQFISRNGHSLE